MPLPIHVSPQALSSQSSLRREASAADAANSLNELQITVSRLHGKVQQLKRAQTDDPLQQQQSEAIIELFNAVAWIQRILWPTVEQLLVPGGNFDAVRDAAGGGGGAGVAGGSVAGKAALSATLARSQPVKRV